MKFENYLFMWIMGVLFFYGVYQMVIAIVLLIKSNRKLKRERFVPPVSAIDSFIPHYTPTPYTPPVVNDITVDGIVYRVGDVIKYNNTSNGSVDRITITDIDNGKVYFFFHSCGIVPFNLLRSTFHFAFQQGRMEHITMGIEPRKNIRIHEFI